VIGLFLLSYAIIGAFMGLTLRHRYVPDYTTFDERTQQCVWYPVHVRWPGRILYGALWLPSLVIALVAMYRYRMKLTIDR